jgi:anti-sigma B factor antagonist
LVSRIIPLIRSNPMTGLKIDSKELPTGWHCLSVTGEIDLATVPDLENAIESVFSTNSHPLVIDLRDSSFMDSTGLKALVMANRRFDENGRGFAIAVSGGPVSRLIDLSGVESSIKIVDSTEELEEVESA